MRRILYALKYGNGKTKFYIITIFILFLFGGASGVICVLRKSPLWGMTALFSSILGIIIMNSVSFKGPVTKLQFALKGKKGPKPKKDDIENEDEEKQGSDYIQKYNESNVKKLFVTYKVNKSHIPVMIDSIVSERVYHCPAYAWLEKDHLQLLLLEKEAKVISVPKKTVTKIVYCKGEPANPKTDYAGFSKPSFISAVFKPYLPTIYEEKQGVHRASKKNLYCIGTDIYITNTSARAIIDMLSLDITLPEEEIYNKKYSPYFTAAYKLSIQLRDGVISVKEYKLKIKNVLQKLAEASLSFETFYLYLNQLIQGRLITKEYAQYYLDYRKKKG